MCIEFSYNCFDSYLFLQAISCVLVEMVPSQFLDALEKVAFGIKVQKILAFSLNQLPNMLSLLVEIASTEVDATFALAIVIVTMSALVICDVLKDPISDQLFLAAYFYLGHVL